MQDITNTYQIAVNKLVWNQNLRKAAERYLQLRALVPMTSIKHTASTGGNLEQLPTDRISRLEDRLMKGGAPLTSAEIKSVISDYGEVFDYKPGNRQQASVRAKYVAQHLITMKQSFPLIHASIAAKGLEDFATNTMKIRWGIYLRRPDQIKRNIGRTIKNQ